MTSIRVKDGDLEIIINLDYIRSVVYDNREKVTAIVYSNGNEKRLSDGDKSKFHLLSIAMNELAVVGE